MKKNTFSKHERLNSHKSIDILFQQGESVKKYPFRSLYTMHPNGGGNVKVAIMVPKRLFKKAVDRNLLKRRFREAYRQNKHTLREIAQAAGFDVAIAFIYTSPNLIQSEVIEKAVVNLLQQIQKGLSAKR